MIRTIFLLSPIYVTFIWFVALLGNQTRNNVPRIILGQVMFLSFLIYLAHFFYFDRFPAIYPYFDSILQFSSLLVFPLYYIYFRLLTVDEVFSIKVHTKFIILPIIVSLCYGIAVLVTPRVEYRAWLYNNDAYARSPQIQFLVGLRYVIKIVYLFQVVTSVTTNYFLLKKYREKIEQFYSNIEDGKYHNAKMLNASIIVMGITAFVFTILGRYSIMPLNKFIYFGWTIFSATLFIIGYMGIKQRPVIPAYESLSADDGVNHAINITEGAHKKILYKLLLEFNQKKIYLNSELNIMDVVEAVGSNRTYISLIINEYYNQNFCSFVNSHRIEELEHVLKLNPEYPNNTLAELCGFGSINSMKRAVLANTGLSLVDWKIKMLVDSL